MVIFPESPQAGEKAVELTPSGSGPETRTWAGARGWLSLPQARGLIVSTDTIQCPGEP